MHLIIINEGDYLASCSRYFATVVGVGAAIATEETHGRPQDIIGS
jgi:hypothetical protein